MDELAIYIGAAIDETTEAKKKMILRELQNQFANQISLTGIAHCFRLIMDKTPGFNEKLYGLNPSQISGLIKRYIGKLKEKKANLEDSKESIKFKENKEKRVQRIRQEPDLNLQKQLFEQEIKRDYPPQQFNRLQPLRKERKYISLSHYCRETNKELPDVRREINESYKDQYEELGDKEKEKISFEDFMKAKTEEWLIEISKEDQN